VSRPFDWKRARFGLSARSIGGRNPCQRGAYMTVRPCAVKDNVAMAIEEWWRATPTCAGLIVRQRTDGHAFVG